MVSEGYKIMNVPELQIFECPWNKYGGYKIMNVPELQILSILQTNMEGQNTLQGCLFHIVVSQWGCVDTWKCDTQRNLSMFLVFLMWGWCWDCRSPFSTLQNMQISYGKFLSISKASRGQFLERLLILFLSGRKLELEQGIETWEDHPRPYMVGYLERKKCKIFWG